MRAAGLISMLLLLLELVGRKMGVGRRVRWVVLGISAATLLAGWVGGAYGA